MSEVPFHLSNNDKNNTTLAESIPLAILLLSLVTGSSFILVEIVPKDLGAVNENDAITPYVSFPSSLIKNVTVGMHVILIVIFGGALGGSIHALASMSHHTKKGTLDRKYVLWYISRPFIGAAIALTVHFAIRGGILTASSDIGFLNPYGVAALSIIVGLMTEQVTEKLKTVFNALFGLDGKSHVQSS